MLANTYYKMPNLEEILFELAGKKNLAKHKATCLKNKKARKAKRKNKK